MRGLALKNPAFLQVFFARKLQLAVTKVEAKEINPNQQEDLEVEDEVKDVNPFMKLDLQIDQQEADWKSSYYMPLIWMVE